MVGGKHVAVSMQRRQDVTAKSFFRLAAIEEHMRDVRVLGKQGWKVVGDLFGDLRV